MLTPGAVHPNLHLGFTNQAGAAGLPPTRATHFARAAFPTAELLGKDSSCQVRLCCLQGCSQLVERCAAGSKGGRSWGSAAAVLYQKTWYSTSCWVTCLPSCSYVSTCSLRFLTFLMAWTGCTCSDIFPPQIIQAVLHLCKAIIQSWWAGLLFLKWVGLTQFKANMY